MPSYQMARIENLEYTISSRFALHSAFRIHMLSHLYETIPLSAPVTFSILCLFYPYNPTTYSHFPPYTPLHTRITTPSFTTPNTYIRTKPPFPTTISLPAYSTSLLLYILEPHTPIPSHPTPFLYTHRVDSFHLRGIGSGICEDVVL